MSSSSGCEHISGHGSDSGSGDDSDPHSVPEFDPADVEAKIDISQKKTYAQLIVLFSFSITACGD